MKFAIILASICCALLLGGCADQLPVTDEESASSPKKEPAYYDVEQNTPSASSPYSTPRY
jgi:hypothetical protein